MSFFFLSSAKVPILRIINFILYFLIEYYLVSLGFSYGHHLEYP